MASVVPSFNVRCFGIKLGVAASGHIRAIGGDVGSSSIAGMVGNERMGHC